MDNNDKVRLTESLRDAEFHLLDPETKTKILTEWVKVDHAMRAKGQKSPVWDGKAPMEEIIGSEVVAKTEKGEMVGKAIYSTTLPDVDGVYKHGVIVHVPASGSIFCVHGRNVRLAHEDDKKLMQTQVQFARKLQEATGTVEVMVKEKRSRRVSGVHLLDSMLQVAKDKKLVVEDKTGFHKIFGNKKGVCVYLATKGGRADLSGFCIDHVGVKPLTEEEAKAKHLGKVRGQINFDRDDKTVMDAWEKVLTFLG